MPRLERSRIELDPERYKKLPTAPIAEPLPFRPTLPPELPIAIRRSSVLISSMPSITTNVDGILRQFYGSNLPTRRLTFQG